VPSIPGYGYSTPLKKPVDVVDTAQYFDALMRFLHGNDCEYFAHGEDWGSLIASFLAKLYPTRVTGIQITLTQESYGFTETFYNILNSIAPSMVLTSEELKYDFATKTKFFNKLSKVIKETGYMHYQATKPDTIGHALSDSPVGLLTYILEKYSVWTFDFKTQIMGVKDGGLSKFSKDDLLSVVTYYWMTNSITSSMRYYRTGFYEGIFGSSFKSSIYFSRVPNQVAVSIHYSVNEIFLVPYQILKLSYPNLQQYTITKNGGHFAAFETPELAASKLINFILHA
jgi:hypothetical protein